MKNIILISSFLLIYSLNSFGQLNNDSLFVEAQKNTSNKEYEKALSQAKQILITDITNSDALLLIANIYIWQGDYLSSYIYFNKLYTINPKNQELYDSWLNMLLWSKNYNLILSTTQKAEENGYSNAYNITLKKALAYKGLEEYQNGITEIENNKAFLDSTAIKSLYNELTLLNKKFYLSAFYTFDIFDNGNPSPHQLGYLEFGTKINNNTLVLRQNWAKKFNTNDYQTEIDYYQTFANKEYIYINYGFGYLQNIFPRHRVGLEYYFPLRYKFETSIGGRYLSFPNSEVYIATGSLSKYFNNSFLSIKPFYVFRNNGNILSARVNYRLYGKNDFTYWGIELGYGNSPDDLHLLYTPTANSRLQSYSIKLEKNLLLYDHIIHIAGGYAIEEITNNVYRSKYLGELMITYKF